MSRKSDREALYGENVSAVRARDDDRRAYVTLKKISKTAPGDANTEVRCRETEEKIIKKLHDKHGKAGDHDERTVNKRAYIPEELSTYFDNLQDAVGPTVSTSTTALFAQQMSLSEELLRRINHIGEYPEAAELSERVSGKSKRDEIEYLRHNN